MHVVSSDLTLNWQKITSVFAKCSRRTGNSRNQLVLAVKPRRALAYTVCGGRPLRTYESFFACLSSCLIELQHDTASCPLLAIRSSVALDRRPHLRDRNFIERSSVKTNIAFRTHMSWVVERNCIAELTVWASQRKLHSLERTYVSNRTFFAPLSS